MRGLELLDLRTATFHRVETLVEGSLATLGPVSRREEAKSRSWHLAALGLGVASMAVVVLLILIDVVSTSTSWIHHAGVSAAPLLLVGGALTVTTVIDRPKGLSLVMRLVTVSAFSAWGLSQLFPNSGSGAGLDDIAILLFVIDAGVIVILHVGPYDRMKEPDSPTTNRQP
jgi:hypothetical protein